MFRWSLFISFLLSLPLSQNNLNTRYHTYDEISDQLEIWDNEFGELETPYPEVYPGSGIIYHLEQIGISSQDSLPIWGVRLSDNAYEKEDEPRVLILGQHHAEEIYGVEIAMALIDRFLHPDNTEFSDIIGYLQLGMILTEIWIVPTLNPEGLKVVHGYEENDNLFEDNYFRKNIRDVNDNGILDYEIGIGDDLDGVDLNRNYDLNWIFGDELWQADNGCADNPSYIANYDYYRGTEPFSELEIQAVRDLALEQNFLLSIAYHSSRSGCVSEKVIYPWAWEDSKHSPDFRVIEKLGIEIAELIVPEAGTGTYYPVGSKSRKGNAHDWFYRETGCFQYLIEVGTDNMQPDDSLLIENTIDRNLRGFFHLLDRAAGTNYGSLGAEKHQITGIVTDVETGSPIEGVIVKILDMDGAVLKPRKTDSFGRYRRLLKEGIYNVEISHQNFETNTHEFYASGGSVFDYDVSLITRPVYDLIFNISSPEGFNGEFRAFLVTPHSETELVSSGIISTSLPADNYTITIIAEGLAPAILEITLDSDLSIPVEFQHEEVIWEDSFDDLSQWLAEEGNWIVENGVVKSQSGLLYENDAGLGLGDVLTTGLEDIFNPGDSLIIELSIRYELEWDHDVFTIYFNDDWDVNEFLILGEFTGDSFEFQKYFLPLKIPENYSGYGGFTLIMNTDSTVNYRGVEIDQIRVLKGTLLLENPVGDDNSSPKEFSLEQNYPNPFNPVTKINYSVPSEEDVSITLFNIRGEEIMKLVQSWHSRGSYSVTVDAGTIPSGIYFYQLKTGETQLTKKLMVLK